MNKKGFFLIECSIALLILMMLTGSYGWYLWQSLACQRMMAVRLASTTSMSNYIEQLYASDTPAHNDTNGITTREQTILPPITGPWSSLCHLHDTCYRLMKIQMNIRNETGQEEHCLWYAGLIDQHH